METNEQILAQRLPALLPELDKRYWQLREILHKAATEGELDEIDLDLKTNDMLALLDTLLPQEGEEDA